MKIYKVSKYVYVKASNKKNISKLTPNDREGAVHLSLYKAYWCQRFVMKKIYK